MSDKYFHKYFFFNPTVDDGGEDAKIELYFLLLGGRRSASDFLVLSCMKRVKSVHKYKNVNKIHWGYRKYQGHLKNTISNT